MEKSVIVKDEQENIIGRTYPRRARGLVKKGRAEYAADGSENTIRLLDTPAPTKKSEVKIMSNIINFNAREFRFDPDCGSKAGTRVVTTDIFGNNIESFEIGDWQWTWTQIVCDKRLEPNTEYIFRFAMAGGCNDTNDPVAQLYIAPFTNEDTRSADWDDRWVYPLGRSQYKPVISTRDQLFSLLRVYEVPFTTTESGLVRFIFAAQHAVTAFMPAYENEKYADLEELTYEQWYKERCKQLGFGESSSDIGTITIDGVNLDLSGAVISQTALGMLLGKVGKGSEIDLSGAVIQDDGSSDEDNWQSEIEQRAEEGRILGLKAAYKGLKAAGESLADGPQKAEMLSAAEQIKEELEADGIGID